MPSVQWLLLDHLHTHTIKLDSGLSLRKLVKCNAALTRYIEYMKWHIGTHISYFLKHRSNPNTMGAYVVNILKCRKILGFRLSTLLFDLTVLFAKYIVLLHWEFCLLYTRNQTCAVNDDDVSKMFNTREKFHV